MVKRLEYRPFEDEGEGSHEDSSDNMTVDGENPMTHAMFE